MVENRRGKRQATSEEVRKEKGETRQERDEDLEAETEKVFAKLCIREK